MKIAVYTSITAGKDTLKEDQNFHGADFIAYTAMRRSQTSWQTRDPCRLFADPNRNAKIHKILAHEYLADYDYSFWIDGSVRLVQPVEELVQRYLADSDIAFFQHHARSCSYEEARVCMERNLDSPALIAAQMDRYRAAGFPEENGLYAATVILRRHTPQIERFNELWWAEISRFSRRDQLSLGFVLWKLGIKPAAFPATVYSSPSILTWSQHRRVRWQRILDRVRKARRRSRW